jgi:Signal recognition particle receptor beta subunit
MDVESPSAALQSSTTTTDSAMKGAVVESEQAVPIRTTIRRAVLPYLPPPLVRTIRHIDPLLSPYVGDEASITIMGSLLIAYLVYFLLKLSSFSRKAIVDDEEEAFANSLQQKSFSKTVLLVGPPRVGKTRLFYQLCHDILGAKTAISLRPNVGFKDETRFMDYPGHSALGALPMDVLSSSRILLLLDATQPAAAAAELFLQLLMAIPKKPTVLVLCHQSDKTGAKNSKRLRLQLRTEMERLLKTTHADANLQGWTPGQPINLEQVANLAFISTSVVNETGMDMVKKYINDGVLPEQTDPTKR